jgi:hypothetical protein
MAASPLSLVFSGFWFIGIGFPLTLMALKNLRKIPDVISRRKQKREVWAKITRRPGGDKHGGLKYLREFHPCHRRTKETSARQHSMATTLPADPIARQRSNILARNKNLPVAKPFSATCETPHKHEP